jgi:mandelate racemase
LDEGRPKRLALAAAAGIPISTHLYPEVAAHVMRVTETRTGSSGKIGRTRCLQEPYEVKDGKLHIPDVPGVGLEWDEKAVDAHLADNF